MFKKRKGTTDNEAFQDTERSSAEATPEDTLEDTLEATLEATPEDTLEATPEDTADEPVEKQELSRRERKALKKELKKEKRARKKADKASGRRGLRRKLSLSIFLYLFDRYINFLYSQLIKGFFGRIFTAYSKEQEDFEKSFAVKYVRGLDKFENWAQRSRKKFARAFESSFLLGKLGELFKTIVSLPLKYYGNFRITHSASLL